MHESPFGLIPGYVLHANYIEALLDDRFLRPVPLIVEVIAIVLYILAVWLLFELGDRFSPEVLLLIAVLVTGGVVAGIRYFVMESLQSFPRLWPGCILFLIASYLETRIHKLAER